jgi:anthranilate synthase component I
VLIRIGSVSTTVVGRGVTPTAAQHAAARVRTTLLRKSRPTFSPARTGTGRFSLEFSDYIAAVRKAKEHIVDGEIFQVVLSIACTASATADGLVLYANLTALNPSPFQFWYRGPEFEAIGTSPEPCVALKNGHVSIRPLAGTRPCGIDHDADQIAELDLRSSDKELAEHRMLVDLARNDLGRVCKPGSVHVPQLMVVERYSHVMHLASDVVGRLRKDRRADNVIRATFPAGTMTGAPKVRAMEIIDELEPTCRGLYSGAVGAFGVDRVNLYLTIRSIVLRQGQVRLQAGSGIVYDSDPTAEYKECVAKLQAASHVVDIDMDGAVS